MLYHVEGVVGGPTVFEPFVKSYVQHFASKSITTDDWKNYLYDYMKRVHGQAMVDKLNTIDFATWIHSPGMPPVNPDTLFDASLAEACYSLANAWDNARESTDLSHFSAKDMATFTTAQKCKYTQADVDLLML